jgi:hypothetical protein
MSEESGRTARTWREEFGGNAAALSVGYGLCREGKAGKEICGRGCNTEHLPKRSIEGTELRELRRIGSVASFRLEEFLLRW